MSSKAKKKSRFDHSVSSEYLDVIVLTARSDNYMYIIVGTCSPLLFTHLLFETRFIDRRTSGKRNYTHFRNTFYRSSYVAKTQIHTHTDKKTNECGVVDPFDSKKVVQEVKRRGLNLSCILTTHSHFDHAGGNKDLLKRVPSISVVYGGKNDKVSECTKEVEEGDTFNIGKNLSVSVMYTPCHTPGHVCYVVKASDCAPSVFTGDALFVSGCGNFNTGTPAQMASAFQRLGKLPMNTLVWAGHEYTVSNLAYACFVEPESKILRAKTEWAKSQVASKAFTVPSTIQEEHEMKE